MLNAPINQTIRFNADEIAGAFAHIELTWPALTKSQEFDDGTLIGLPFPYIVPSAEPQNGFVFEEMYYWDSYFTAQGLLQSGRHELAEGMLENLLFLYKRFHIIPNASRFYFTSRSQPPLLTSYIMDIYEHCQKDTNWLRERMEIAEREYNNVWLRDIQPSRRNIYKGLSRYYDINVLDDLAECESGWDMTTRFYGNCLSYVPIDLNSLLHKYELDFAKTYDILGDSDTAEIWRGKGALRAQTMNAEMWDDRKGFYFDLDYVAGAHSDIWSLASLYPLWAGVATQEQAERVVANLDNFMYEGGLSTTTSNENEIARMIAHQWAYPNGWAPLQWIVTEALSNYGYHEKAEQIARRWINTNLQYFKEYGVFREAYNVTDIHADPAHGVYPPQVGFGWTNAVFTDLAKKYLSDEELLKV